MKKLIIGAALLAAVIAPMVLALDLPWVYDSSARIVVEEKSVAIADSAGNFDTMVGHWRYTSNNSDLVTVKPLGFFMMLR